MKTKILFIVSNLRRTGPVNQLFYIVTNLCNTKFECKILTLSDEPRDSKESKINDFIDKGISINTLSLPRLKSIFFSKNIIKEYIINYAPNIIQTQGIRADILVAKCSLEIPWVTTSRNIPMKDYPSKFGKLKGYIMAKQHINALSKCRNLVSCSNSIGSELLSLGIKSTIICNGVPIESNLQLQKIQKNDITRKIKFISVGSLIPRKNMSFVIKIIQELQNYYDHLELIILGSGPELSELKKIQTENITFLGNVPNVSQYLLESDIFISASLAEGLPNTVLEAIAHGVPTALSCIPPHEEISTNIPQEASFIFSLDESPQLVASKLKEKMDIMLNLDKSSLSESIINKFGDKHMSNSYQNLYMRILNETKL